MKTEYVVGFLFTPKMDYVALIRKLRPDWQANRLNGIGGHVEKDEGFEAAMVREFSEEVSFEGSLMWRQFADLDGKDFFVACFYAVSNSFSAVHNIGSKTDEVIEVWPVKDIQFPIAKCVENLPWLVSLAIDCRQDMCPSFATITYP